MLPREVANIHREKHNILVFLSNTLFFLLFTSLFPPFSQFQKMGGTWEELGRYMGGTFSFYLRYVLAFQSIPKRSSIEDKAKFYRRSIEHLSNIYRTPIEDLSKTYRREYVSTVLSTSTRFVCCSEEWAYRQVFSF